MNLFVPTAKSEVPSIILNPFKETGPVINESLKPMFSDLTESIIWHEMTATIQITNFSRLGMVPDLL